MRSNANSQDIDLSTAAFADVVAGGVNVGVSYANWNWVDCNSGSLPAPQPQNLPAGTIADWKTCTSTDTCADPTYVCCVAPGDVSNNKSTCRPNNLSNCATLPSSRKRNVR
ncbi:hypothetical protein HDU98_004322 [Podochytrium sp. JEL0797]|nr:hypothetical protein HDU98_004322 [Podochytrium sp. JEL0797]